MMHFYRVFFKYGIRDTYTNFISCQIKELEQQTIRLVHKIYFILFLINKEQEQNIVAQNKLQNLTLQKTLIAFCHEVCYIR